MLSPLAQLFVLFVLSWPCDAASSSVDYFLSVQEWPPTVCETNSPDHKCNEPPNWNAQPRWTIHGLWPNSNGTEGPNYCNKSAVFNLTALQDLLTQLQYNWPNMIGDSQAGSFWEHEWLKHGTCAMSVDSLTNEHDYFAAALAVYYKFNMTYKALASSGIVPSSEDTYKISDVYDSLTAAYKVKPIIECGHKETLGQYLMEVHVCLDTSLKPFDCGDFVYTDSPCHPEEPVKYFAAF